ncbi:programmed cell death protein 7 [Eucyclogobius newberryi]|uniref:programmed cell death protein 7 n=1 Tax=Eucyclogobius newberryi TaxID=166745 RepID=UPI003B5A60D1
MQRKMDNSYPYPASDAPPPPGFSANPARSSYTAAHNMSAPDASAPPGGAHASAWSASQMSFHPPTYPGSGNFGAPPMPFPHPFNPALPPPQIGYPPPPPPPPGVTPVPAPWSQSGPHPGSVSGPPPGQYSGPPGQYSGPPGQYSGPPGQYSGPHHSSLSGPPLGLPGQYSSPPLGPPGQYSGPHHSSVSGPPPGPFSGSRPGPHSGPPFAQSNYRPRLAAHPPNQNRPHQQFPESGRTFSYERETFVAQAAKPKPEDEAAVQRREDQKWITQFLETKGRSIKNPPRESESRPPNQMSVGEMKHALYSTARLVSQLATACEHLKVNVDDQSVWTESYGKALEMKREIQSRLKMIADDDNLQQVKAKLSAIAKRKARRVRTKKRLRAEEQQREAEIAEKDDAIEKWRMKKIHEEVERKKEEELKRTADAVLCEVRKKQADVKRTLDILKSLEKLRKLRKEAASRKGIFTDRQSDEAFDRLLEELRGVARKRTAVYGAEERALMVMLEGEQEEERRRELEDKRKRERDKQTQRRRRVDALLFGEDTPPDPFMQPFRQYYTQAELSLPALVQIRREWDVFLVPAEHPEASAVPRGWVLPDPPSDQAWASALQSSDTECEDV